MSQAALDSDEIFLADDDANLCDLLSLKLSDAGFRTTTFTKVADFLDVARRRTPACVILDVFMPERSGIALVSDISGKQYPAPIIVMTARATVPMAVEAVKNGAFDIIEKPFDPDNFVERIRGTIDRWRQNSKNDLNSAPLSMDFPGAQRLTSRERDVLAEITAASSNKEAGRNLGLSPRTVEVHRAHIMMKLGVKNTADLMRFVLSKRHAD
jgi:two-component system, LuxR family, response regulator FixJ